MSLTQQVVSSLKWTLGLRMLAQGVTWCSTFFVMRLLSPDDYGLMAMSAFLVTLLGLIAGHGFGSALVQAAEIEANVVRQVFGVVILANVAIVVALWSLAPLMAIVFQEPRTTPIIRVVALQFIPGALAVVPEAMLKRRMDFRTLSLIEFSGTLIASAVTLALALSGAGVWTLVAGLMTTAIWRAIGVNWKSPVRCLPVFSFSGMRHYAVFGGRVTTSAVLWFVFTEADIFLAGRSLGTTVVGFYSISKQLASLPLQRVSQVLNQVIYPAFARIQDEPERAADKLLKSVRLISFVAVPVIWGISCVSRELILVILGSKWEPAILPLQLLGLVIPFRLISTSTATIALGMGRSDVTLNNTIVSCLVMTVAFLVAVQFGLMGLSLVWVLVYPWVLAYSIGCSVGVVGLGLRDLLRTTAPTLTAGLGMYAAVLSARAVLPAGVPGELQLGFLVLVGAATYTGLSLAFNRQPVREIVALVR